MAVFPAIPRLWRRLRGFTRKYILSFLTLLYIIISSIWNVKTICKPPNLNPFDDSIKHLIKDPDFDGCTYPLLFSSFNSTLVTLSDLGGKGIKSCCYQGVTRRSYQDDDPDVSYSLSKECYPVGVNKSETVIPNGTEFIIISCKNGSERSNRTVNRMMDIHSFVHDKPEVENRIRKYYARVKSGAKGLSEEDKVNVVIFGTDSVSQQEFQRSFQKTYKYLKEDLSAYEMRGRNLVGDGTFRNIAPMLSGLHFQALRNKCFRDDFHVNCPFIWRKYSEHGYRTSFGEDAPARVGLVNLHNKGFREPPTDYYTQPFSVAADVLIGNAANANLNENRNICYGPRLTFEVLLDYMKKTANFMGHEKRYFQFIWSNYLTHDHMNFGRLGDEMYLNTLKWFKDGGYLNKTVLILMSDHGKRFGEIRDLRQGILEERLPYLFYVVPSWFEKKYWKACKNLKRNRDKLTTPFDLHKTLLDLLHLDLNTSAIALRESTLTNPNTSLPRGISHFLPIPPWRNCDLAHIPQHYCTCRKLTALPSAEANEDVKEAAIFILSEINSMLREYGRCAVLILAKIRHAFKIDFGFDKKGGFMLSLETLPGQAHFEATVMKQIGGNWTVSGGISRTNSYANHSSCVDNSPQVKSYCYCKS